MTKDFTEIAKLFVELNGSCDDERFECENCVFEIQGQDQCCPPDSTCYGWAIGYLHLKELKKENS